MDCIIRNGLVYTGKDEPPEKRDILIKGDLIIDTDAKLHASCVHTVIDASDCVVTPGFVDIHRHCDDQPMLNDRFGELESLQGITTVIAGNCGLAPVPFTKTSGKDVLNLIEPCLGNIPMSLVYEYYHDYSTAVSSVPQHLNFGYLAGTGAIKASIKGFSNAPYTDAEMAKAVAVLQEGLDAGAFGASLGIMYPPECYSTREEFIRLIKPVSSVGGLVCCHIRGEGDSLVSSIDEIIDIAKTSGNRLNISHLKATGIRNWKKSIYQAVQKIEKARTEGQNISADFYPYEGGSTTIQSLIPPCCIKGSVADTIIFLNSSAGRSLFCSSITRQFSYWDNMVESIGWNRIRICSSAGNQYRDLQGLDFEEAADKMHTTPADLACDLYIAEEGKVGIIVMSMDPEDVNYVARLPYVSVISDSLYGGGTVPHPRLYGAFPKFLREYAIDKKLIPLETAIYKMTLLPAEKIGLKNRGEIKAGNYADINVFKLKDFRDNATYENPCQPASGLKYCFINGETVVQNGRYLDAASGKFLTRV